MGSSYSFSIPNVVGFSISSQTLQKQKAEELNEFDCVNISSELGIMYTRKADFGLWIKAILFYHTMKAK